MSNNVNDVSGLVQRNGTVPMLPMRSEKRVRATLLEPSDLIDGGSINDYKLIASRTPQYDHVRIRIAGRGGDTPGVFDPNSSVDYSFLIAPSDVQVGRQILDEQSFTRSGWQVGLWGEDFINITLAGKTPGRYWKHGTTDTFTPLSMSYRNLLALEILVENNGYWFEGEQAQNALSIMPSSRQIKMHSDVELTVGEFIWSGMFETMEVSEDAETPFLADFNLSFIAWKETYRAQTPYPNSIGGEIQRGHVPGPVVKVVTEVQVNTAANSAISALILNPIATFGP